MSYYNGGLKYPKWSEEEVEDLFLKHKGLTSRVNRIIGGTVGSVTVLLLIAACALFIAIRIKREKERESATGRMPSINETEQRKAAGGLYEADASGLLAEASGVKRRIPEVDTGHPIPQESDSTALQSTFELQNAMTRHLPPSTGNLNEPDGPVSPDI